MDYYDEEESFRPLQKDFAEEGNPVQSLPPAKSTKEERKRPYPRPAAKLWFRQRMMVKGENCLDSELTVYIDHKESASALPDAFEVLHHDAQVAAQPTISKNYKGSTASLETSCSACGAEVADTLDCLHQYIASGHPGFLCTTCMPAVSTPGSSPRLSPRPPSEYYREADDEYLRTVPLTQSFLSGELLGIINRKANLKMLGLIKDIAND